jgi:hypothetical protein
LRRLEIAHERAVGGRARGPGHCSCLEGQTGTQSR